MAKKISQILLLLSRVISLVGAIYIALVHHAHMISFSLSPQHLAHRAGSYGHRLICDIAVNFKCHAFSPL